MGDLVTCGDVLLNYLEAYDAIPWDDLRYMFGEVGAAPCTSGQRHTLCAPITFRACTPTWAPFGQRRR